ncbi:hypothetical protein FB451DRAFT_772544 [Mycena latifolia]|nr:hypothetical protein FB451DRAFT_772544 [Mycena latifolia]
MRVSLVFPLFPCHTHSLSPASQVGGIVLHAMPTFDRFSLLFVLFSSLAGQSALYFSSNGLAVVVAQSEATEVTLWQFGRPRLLGGSVILPLQPLGTAPDGSATTYLYQAVNPSVITSVDAAGLLTTQITAIANLRTIIASASGWVEPFGSADIACSFINPEFGACVDETVGVGTSTANSGVPTPQVLQVALTAPPLPTFTLPTPTLTLPPTVTESPPTFLTSPIISLPLVSASAASSTSNPKLTGRSSPPVGAIVGGAVGGLAVLGLAVVLFVFGRRRRFRQMTNDIPASKPVRFNPTPHAKAAVTAPAASGLWEHHGRWPQGVARAEYNYAADHAPNSIPDADSLQRNMVEIVDRLRRLEGEGSVGYEEPPPTYGHGYTQA